MRVALRDWRNKLRDDRSLSPAAKLLGYTLSTYAELDGASASPGYVQLAEDISKSLSTVERSIRELRAAGYISEAHKGHSFGAGSTSGVFTTHRLEVPSRG